VWMNYLWDMKKYIWCLILTLCHIHFSFGQIFHFDEDSTVLIKDVSQSPAHWYLEIFNDIGIDTTLRWKCHYSNVPAQWNANFDDQNMFYPTVLSGDSADFILYSGLSFPQKLIIGVTLNGTPGIGTYYFDIYNPETPDQFVTIQYHFIVSQSSTELGEIYSSIGFQRIGDYILFSPQLLGQPLKVLDFGGKVVYEGIIASNLRISKSSEGLIFWVLNNENPIIFKEISQY